MKIGDGDLEAGIAVRDHFRTSWVRLKLLVVAMVGDMNVNNLILIHLSISMLLFFNFIFWLQFEVRRFDFFTPRL